MLAKLDTGALGSVIHATDIEILGPPERAVVRFRLHPLPERPDLVAPCTAPLVSQRRVTSSNGVSELRPFIRTELRVAGLSCTAELSLTGRSLMRHRMLLGRAVLAGLGVLVDPSRGGRATQSEPSGLDPVP